ncbi:MAG: Ig-like domain-containing protein [Oscillospiraceae bacterium]|nr:Ig-like domain-containing protein [Oscillospiraceae bacterium]
MKKRLKRSFVRFVEFALVLSLVFTGLPGAAASEGMPDQAEDIIISEPTSSPEEEPIKVSTEEPAAETPTPIPTLESTEEPTLVPTAEPTEDPTLAPTEEPTLEPSSENTPTPEPSSEPTTTPTSEPTLEPILEESPEPAEQLTVSLTSPNRLTVGKTASFKAVISGAVGNPSIKYKVLINGASLQETVSASTSFEYTAKVPALFEIIVQVTDEAGRAATASSGAIEAVYGGAASASGIPDFPDEYYGEGVISSGLGQSTAGFSPLELKAIYAYLAELRVVYMTMNTPLIRSDTNTTWEMRVSGGDGVYKFYYQLNALASNGTSALRTEAHSSAETTSKLFVHKTKYNQYGYYLNVWITDQAGNYVMYQSTRYYCVQDGEETNANTVAGKVALVISQVITSGMSQEQKAKALHDYIAMTSTYDEYGGRYEPSANPKGVLLVGKGVCASYSEAYRLLCLAAGIECVTIYGEAGSGNSWGAHAWNMIKLDGVWYHVDTLWDDNGTNTPSTTYWKKTDATLPSDHRWDNDIYNDEFLNGMYPTGGEDAENTIITNIVATPKITVNIGLTENIVVDHLPAHLPSPTYTFKSRNTTIAAVNANGVVSGVKAGTTKIDITTPDGIKVVTSVTVTDLYKPTAVSLNVGAAYDLPLGQTLYLSPALTPSNAITTFTWTNSSSAVLQTTQYSSFAAFKGLKVGKSTVTVKTGNGKSAKVSVNVYDPLAPTSITLSKSGTVDAPLGTPLYFEAALEFETARGTITYTSSSPTVASLSHPAATLTSSNVDSNYVNPLKVGKSTITAKTANGKSAKFIVNVYDPYLPVSITLDSAGTVDVPLGNYHVFGTTVGGEIARTTVTYTSSSKTIASVVNSSAAVTGSAGVDNWIYAAKVGKATITAKTANGKSAKFIVNVFDPNKPTKIMLDRTGTVDINVNEKIPLGTTITPSSAYPQLTWKSSNIKIAAVSQTGEITGIAEGTATITVSAVDYSTIKATVKVKVTDPAKPTSVIIRRGLGNEGRVYHVGDSFEAWVYLGTANEMSSSFTWTIPAAYASKIDEGSYAQDPAGLGYNSARYALLELKRTGTFTVQVKTANGKIGKITITVLP